MSISYVSSACNIPFVTPLFQTRPVPIKESQQRVARSKTKCIQEVPYTLRGGRPTDTRAMSATFDARVARPFEGIKVPSPLKGKPKTARRGMKVRKESLRRKSLVAKQKQPPTPKPRNMVNDGSSSAKGGTVAVHVTKVDSLFASLPIPVHFCFTL